MRASSLPARTAWAASARTRRSAASESAARCPAAAAARCAPRCAVHRAPRTACRASLRAATAGAHARSALMAVAFASQAAPDAKLLAAGQAAQPAVIDTLKEMVTIESGSANAEGLAKMADYTEKRLLALGAK